MINKNHNPGEKTKRYEIKAKKSFAAIVGIDGCGKTTQAKMLFQRLEKEGYKAMYVQPVFVLLNILTRHRNENITFISPRVISTSIMNDSNEKRKLIFIKKMFAGLFSYPYALATYLFTKFYLSRNKIVVCDRYFYQFFFDLFGDWSEKVIRIFPKPDITFFLDADLELFYSRMNSSFDASVSRGYYADVLNLYRKLSQKYGFIQIDANLNKEEINDIIFMHLIKEMNG